jgi:hypothetical protein
MARLQSELAGDLRVVEWPQRFRHRLLRRRHCRVVPLTSVSLVFAGKEERALACAELRVQLSTRSAGRGSSGPWAPDPGDCLARTSDRQAVITIPARAEAPARRAFPRDSDRAVRRLIDRPLPGSAYATASVEAAIRADQRAFRREGQRSGAVSDTPGEPNAGAAEGSSDGAPVDRVSLDGGRWLGVLGDADADRARAEVVRAAGYKPAALARRHPPPPG